jgi:hypothetical protein
MGKKNLLISTLLFVIGIFIGYIATASPGPAKPNPGHSWSEIECDVNMCVDTTNKRVGIGTTTPAVSGLHIGSGVSGGQAQLRLDNANGNYGGLNRWADRLEVFANDAIGFSVGSVGANQMWITSEGKVGIGTKSPGRKLTVAGDAEIASMLKVGTLLGVGVDPGGYTLKVGGSTYISGDLEAYGKAYINPIKNYVSITTEWNVPKSSNAAEFFDDPYLWMKISTEKTITLFIWVSGSLRYDNGPHTWGKYRITVDGSPCVGSFRFHEAPTDIAVGSKYGLHFDTTCSYQVGPGEHTIKLQFSTNDVSANLYLGERNMFAFGFLP